MQTRVKITAFLLAIILAFSPSTSYAVEHRELSESDLDVIAQGCNSTNIQLQRIQKDDARNRVYLGAQFETVATNLMLNLNLRLVKNGIANASLADQQTAFTERRNKFKNSYISYSQEFDNLLNISCKNEPKRFYEQLEVVREKREKVNSHVVKLRSALSVHRQTVDELRSEL